LKRKTAHDLQRDAQAQPADEVWKAADDGTGKKKKSGP